jgi:hypothetical protein
MAHYRYYTLDHRRGTIKAGFDLEAADNSQAGILAREAAFEHERFEVWCGVRLVNTTRQKYSRHNPEL